MPVIEVARDAHIVTSGLARGSARNALSTAQWQRLAVVVADLAAADARFDAAFAGPELREGLAAFQSRRPPEFP